jgi:hypothetical protein
MPDIIIAGAARHGSRIGGGTMSARAGGAYTI